MTYRGQDTYRRLRWTVRMLASDAAIQIAYLNEATAQAKYQILTDDIATDFDCWFQYAAQFAKGGLLTHQSINSLTALSQRIHAIDPAPENWTAEALASSPMWITIRVHAKAALASMDEHHLPGDILVRTDTGQSSQ
jgi:hypothetical protein